MGSFVAGVVAGLAAAIEKKNRMSLMVVLAVSRVVDSSLSLADSRKLYKRHPKAEGIAIFVISNVLMQYSMGCESEVMNKQINKKMQ